MLKNKSVEEGAESSSVPAMMRGLNATYSKNASVESEQQTPLSRTLGPIGMQETCGIRLR